MYNFMLGRIREIGQSLGGDGPWTVKGAKPLPLQERESPQK